MTIISRGCKKKIKQQIELQRLKGNSHQNLSVANMIEILLKSFLVYHLPMFEAWKVPKRPVGHIVDAVLSSPFLSILDQKGVSVTAFQHPAYHLLQIPSYPLLNMGIPVILCT